MINTGKFLQNLLGKQITSGKTLRGILDLIELVAVLLCIPLAYFLSLYLARNFDLFIYKSEFKLLLLKYFNYYNVSWQFNPWQFAFFTLLVVISWVVFSKLTYIAKLPRSQRYLTILIHFLRGYFFILLGLLGFKFLFNLTSISVIFILTYVVVSFAFTLAIRVLSVHKLRIYRANGYFLRRVMVIADSSSLRFIDALINQKDWGYRIMTLISSSEEVRSKYGAEIPVLEGMDNVEGTLKNCVVDEILYCRKETDNGELMHLVSLCNEIGVVLRKQSGLIETDPLQINLETINSSGRLTLVDSPSFRLPLEIKTILDTYFSLIAMILLLPFLLVIALFIKIDSRGPVLFKQERIGLRGRKFKLYKFRTMVSNAEQILDTLRENNEMDGPTFKMKNDPRITRLGKFLRKTGIDEFPQLLNVIKGEMSLIGPRPPLESEVRQYKTQYIRRLSVKPGITCIWQIMPQRNDIKFEKWMQMDLNYIDNWSLSLDARLFFKTITTIFVAGGR